MQHNVSHHCPTGSGNPEQRTSVLHARDNRNEPDRQNTGEGWTGFSCFAVVAV